jgi:hypothetical protein
MPSCFFEILSIDPCAEDPHQVQLEGRLLQSVAANWTGKAQETGWKVYRIGSQGVIIARGNKGAMLILRPDGDFTLSRIPDRDLGLSLLKELLAP